jgi:hypothetical protein
MQNDECRMQNEEKENSDRRDSNPQQARLDYEVSTKRSIGDLVLKWTVLFLVEAVCQVVLPALVIAIVILYMQTCDSLR